MSVGKVSSEREREKALRRRCSDPAGLITHGKSVCDSIPSNCHLVRCVPLPIAPVVVSDRVQQKKSGSMSFDPMVKYVLHNHITTRQLNRVHQQVQ